ncbi:Glycine-rich RNA-binding protein 2, mitochondrial-like protein [Drosera capensis]
MIWAGRTMYSKLQNMRGFCSSATSSPATLLLERKPSSNLFVGGLSYNTNETALRDAFMQYGDIIEVRVICNHVNSKSRGYGFVKFASENAAAIALKEMNGPRWEKYSCALREQVVVIYSRSGLLPTHLMEHTGGDPFICNGARKPEFQFHSGSC